MAIRNGLLKKLCGSPELLTFKTVKWRYRDKREDDVGTHSQKWQSTKTDQTIPSVQALQYNNITVSKNHFLHFKRYNITVSKNRTTDLQISLFLQFCVSRRYSYSITVLKNQKQGASYGFIWSARFQPLPDSRGLILMRLLFLAKIQRQSANCRETDGRTAILFQTVPVMCNFLMFSWLDLLSPCCSSTP